ncbi:hypothetical protein P405_16515 [Streptomyces sp. FR-008]|nr:hypothetical protein P405_16515 [Streptomyces sp. FR-008]
MAICLLDLVRCAEIPQRSGRFLQIPGDVFQQVGDRNRVSREDFAPQIDVGSRDPGDIADSLACEAGGLRCCPVKPGGHD